MRGHRAQVATAAHIETVALAEYREGLTGRLRSRRISAHLASCESCAAANARLTAVTTALAAVPAPAMPADVKQRLSAAIAAAVQVRAQAGPLPADPGPPPTPHEPARAIHGGPRPPWRRPMALRIAASAAVVCLLAAGGYAVSRVGSGSRVTGSSASASQPSSKRAAAGAAAGTGPANGGPIHAGANNGGPSAGIAYTAIASGTDYQPGQQLRQQVESELGKHPSGAPASAAVAACVDKVTAGVAPTLVDVARYQGQPATVIVVTHVSARGFAWVMDAGCTRKLAGTVLPPAG